MILDILLFVVLWVFFGFIPAIVIMIVFLICGMFFPRKKTIAERMLF